MKHANLNLGDAHVGSEFMQWNLNRSLVHSRISTEAWFIVVCILLPRSLFFAPQIPLVSCSSTLMSTISASSFIVIEYGISTPRPTVKPFKPQLLPKTTFKIVELADPSAPTGISTLCSSLGAYDVRLARLLQRHVMIKMSCGPYSSRWRFPLVSILRIDRNKVKPELLHRMRTAGASSTTVAVVIPKTRADNLEWLQGYLEAQ